MTDFFTKDNFNSQDIDFLIQNNFEESINLDFKESRSLEQTEKKKEEIAKDVSAFANSAGGLIVYGIKEVNHKASEISFIDGNLYTKEWLENIICTRIHRRIDNLLIYPIRYDNDVSKSIYVVKIPESIFAPHMISNKKYYKRFNFESVPMEEYEIRNLYFKANKTSIQIESVTGLGSLRTEVENSHKYLTIDVLFQIRNVGLSVEKDYKIVFKVIGHTKCMIRPSHRYPNNNFTRTILEDNSTVFSFTGIAPIFPNEVLAIGEISLGLSEIDFLTIKERVNLEIRLYYTNGTDEVIFPMNKLFR